MALFLFMGPGLKAEVLLRQQITEIRIKNGDKKGFFPIQSVLII